MAETVDFTYRAFLSYAHADSAWAKWLHKRLEGFRIDKDLVGRATEMGPVPPALRPIFRDREDFSGGHALTDAAIDRSAALIVLCSTVSATRPAVNEEARLFRSRHPDRPVIPVVIGGSYPENFPPALRYEVAADGTVTDRPVTLLGPDLRETGDGRELGLAKIVAALIGVPADDVRKRQSIAESRRIKMAASGIAVFAVLALVAAFLYWQHERQLAMEAARDNERIARDAARDKKLAEMQELIKSRLDASPARDAPGAEKQVGEAIEAAVKGANAGDDRLQWALDLLKAGKPQEAEPLFRAVAEEKERAARASDKEAAAAYRNLGAIAGLGNPKRAREAYAKAVALDATDTEALYWHGRLSNLAGDLRTAEHSLRRLMEIATARSDERGNYRAHLELGYMMVDRGELSTAREHAQKAVDIALQRSSVTPSDLSWQQDLARGQVAIGDALRDQGNLPAALESYRASLAIRERLSKTDPGNAEWQRDLFVSYWRVADIGRQQGNLTAALETVNRGHAIMLRLAAQDAGNSAWQRDLTTIHTFIGDVLVEQGNLPAALDAFKASLAIAERLSKADSGNAGWQRDLSVSYNRIGDVLIAQGNLPAALDAFKASLAIDERLAKTDPANAGWQNDLALSLQRVGLVASQQGQQENALAAYQRGLEIMQRLTALAPDHPAFKRDLAWFEARLSGK